MRLETLLGQMGGNYSVENNHPDVEILSVASPDNAETGSLVFCNRTTAAQLAEVLSQTRASIVVASLKAQVAATQTLVVVADPLAWFIRALDVLLPSSRQALVHPTAVVSETAVMGDRVSIGAGTVVEGSCQIGDNVRIGTGCYLGPGTVLGAGAFVQDHVSLGGVGLGYHMTSDGERLFFPHLGAVIARRDVVIGTGSVVVRGELGDTTLGDRVRLGNLVNIGHNAQVGADTVISSSSSVAGGTRIGERCNIGVGAAISAKLRIEDDCQIGAGSVVVKNVPARTSVFGNPAAPLRTMRRF